MKKHFLYILMACAAVMAGCSDDNSSDEETIDLGPASDVTRSEEYYAGGELGTTTDNSAYAYTQMTPATENANLQVQFMNGEQLFEKDFNQNTEGAFTGLGPLAVRVGCLYCHPAYGHGKRQTRYRASDMGNGYLLVLYDKSSNGYLTSLTGMPQTVAVAPFKSPIDEEKIKIEWLNYTDEWGNKFPDGETYSLIYPEVTIPADAYYVPLTSAAHPNGLTVDEVGIRLESTIGIYGTGLTDAIPDDSITAQWVKESKYFNSIGRTDALNPGYWSQSTNSWTSYYKGLTGKQYVRRYTYALTRGPVEDGPGSNAIWNITNVTRSDRRYHYMTVAYATTASKDPDVQKEFYTYFPEEKTDAGVEQDIYRYLMGKEVTKNADGTYTTGANCAKAEMTDASYKNLMIWHRGLAVPAARNTNTTEFQKGKQLFTQIGCAECHRPSWTTGDDHIEDPNGMLTDSDLPRYPHQKIWPYTDMVQHRLYMENDIRTGWCRTTPLWGRGLSSLCTGAQDRLHDCRARNTMEAIMWHGNANSDARYSIEQFRNLSREERDQIIYFIESI